VNTNLRDSGAGTELRGPVPSAPAPGLVPPRHRRFLGFDRNQSIWWGAFIVLALFVAAPIVPTLVQSVRTKALYDSTGEFSLGAFARLFTEAQFGEVILNTLTFAVLTTVMTLLIAVPIAVVVTRTNLPGKRLFETTMQWPYYVSSLIIGLGWMMIYGPAGFITELVRGIVGGQPWDLYTIPGMALIEAVSVAPIAYMFCRNALLQSDASLEAAAKTSGAPPLRILFSIVIPMMRPAIVYSAVLVFTVAVETLSIPLIIGIPAGITFFSTFLYKNGLQSLNPDYGLLGAASVIILLVAVVLVVTQTRLLRNAQRFVTVRGKATRPKPLDLGKLRWVAFVYVAAYVVIGAGIPLLGIFLRSFTFILTPLRNPLESLTLSNYTRIFEIPAYSGSIVNSLVVASVGAVLVTILVFVVALVAKRSSFRFRRGLDYLALAPQAMPGLIVGIGLFWAIAVLPFGLGGLIHGTLFALIIGFGFRALPSAYGAIAPSILQIGEELDKAANLSGADWLRTVRSILLKILLPSIASAFVLTFISMFKEYSPAIFLQSADSKVFGTTMLEMWAQGATGPVAALAAIQIAIISVVALVASKYMKGIQHA